MKILLIGLIYLFALIQGLHSYEEPTLFSSINERQGPEFPREMTMNIRIGFDYKFAMQHGGPARAIDEIKRIVEISQAHFNHESLKTSIKLNLLKTEYFNKESWQATYTVMEKLRRYASTDPKVHANAFFTYDPHGYGLEGLSHLSSVCGPTSYRVSVIKDGGTPPATAHTLSQQLGHSLGMRRDEVTGTGCNGIMGFNRYARTWSSCSVNDFKNYFDRNQPFCLGGTTPTTTCQNLNNYCDYLERSYPSNWNWICNSWSGRSFVQANCLKYCRKC